MSDTQPLLWVVDDSPMERQITIRSLGPIYRFEELSDGADVVERLGPAGAPLPDLVLLDWVMPGMPGDQVCRFLRSNERTAKLPIILLTASRVETRDVVEGLSSGANDYVARPFVPEELRARVAAALRAKQLIDAATRERGRLTSVNRLARGLLAAGTDVDRIVHELAEALTESVADGCAVLLLPGLHATAAAARHRGHAPDELAAIATVADPVVHEFATTAHALATLPAAYHPYVRRHGMRSLAIVAFPAAGGVNGIATATRDGGSQPFAPEDLATIESCVEYTALAIASAARFEAERAARAQLEAVLDHAPLGIVVTETEGAVALVNAHATRLIPGIERAADLAAVRTLGMWSTLAGEPLAEGVPLFGQQPPGAPAVIREVVLRTEAGATRHLAMTTASLATGHITTLADVTDARAIAAERERYAAFQEQTLAIVGHDLRNPLGALTAGVAVLEALGEGGPQLPGITARLGRSTKRMTKIVDQLLDATRARLGGGIQLQRRPTELVALVRHVLDELVLATPTARFELVAPVDEVRGTWDADRLGQVVSNLAGNAIAYGAPNAQIDVSVRPLSGGAELVIHNQVRDQPIAPDRLATLFDPYRRGGDPGRNTGGLGLGLYIVHEIVRAHGGTIAATSDATGTTFHLWLPAA